MLKAKKLKKVLYNQSHRLDGPLQKQFSEKLAVSLGITWGVKTAEQSTMSVTTFWPKHPSVIRRYILELMIS